MPQPSPTELQELINDGVINADTASAIESWYQQKHKPSANRFTLVLGVFGSLLAGLGIVLLVAHNWDTLSQFAKTVFAFLPLFIAQIVCVYALIKKKGSTIWSESSALFLFFAIPACIALISQIYHVSGSLSGFLFTWLLLSFPLIYIMPSSTVSLFYLIVCTWYATEVGYSKIFGGGYTEQPYYYLLLLALALPHYYSLWKKRRNSNFFHLHNWVLAISLPIVLGTFLDHSYPFGEWGFIGYITLFAIFYLIGTSAYMASARVIANPFLIVGMVGVVGILMLWSFAWMWEEVLNYDSDRVNFFFWQYSWICIAFLVIYGLLLFKAQKDKGLSNISPIDYSPLVLIFASLILRGFPTIGQLLINIWVLLIGLFFVRGGSREDHLGILNFGLLIIVILATLRFFDDSIPFLWRGLFFLLTGAGFFVANYLMLKKRKEAAIKNNPS